MAEITTGGDGTEDPAYGDTPPYTPMYAPAPAPARRDRGGLRKAAGLLAAGLLVGALGATALQTGGSAAAASGSAASTSTGTGRTGTTGETRIVGTVSEVGSGSVEVTDQDGTTTTYTVDSSTQIAKGGALAQLSDLEAGDTVLVHVLTGDVAERIIVGRLAGGGPRAGLPGVGDGLPDGGAAPQQGSGGAALTAPGTET